MADYFARSDLESALGVPIVKAIYDDNHSGNVATGSAATAVAGCIAYAGAMCDSFLRGALQNPVGTGALTLPLETVPNEVKFAALDFGIAYSMRRRPDVVKAMGEQPWTIHYEQAVAQMKRYAASIQQVPASTAHHATSGGDVFGTDPEDDELPEPRWGDMADFS